MNDFFLDWPTAIPLMIAMGILVVMIIIELEKGK